MVADKAVVRASAPPALSFGLFLLCSLVLLARPQDVLPFLQPWRPALVLSMLAMVAIVFGGGVRILLRALSTSEAKRYLLFFASMIVRHPVFVQPGNPVCRRW